MQKINTYIQNNLKQKGVGSSDTTRVVSNDDIVNFEIKKIAKIVVGFAKIKCKFCQTESNCTLKQHWRTVHVTNHFVNHTQIIEVESSLESSARSSASANPTQTSTTVSGLVLGASPNENVNSISAQATEVIRASTDRLAKI